MNDIATAAVLGISLGNVWICALVVFALQTSDRWACGGYLIGRFIGILAFTSVFWLIGGAWQLSHNWVNIISGLAMLLFVAYFFFRYSRGWIPFWVKKRQSAHGADHENCDHDCQKCPVNEDAEMKKYCDDCDDDKACSAEDIQVEVLTRKAREKWGREVSEEKVTGFVGGLAFGGFRGAIMCGRMAVLLPLVMQGSFGHSALVGSTFALTSTVYPVLGMVLGSVVLKFLPKRQLIFNISAVILLVLALYYLYRGITLS